VSRKVTAIQALLLAFGLASVFVLYFFGKTVSEEVKTAEQNTHEGHDHEVVDYDVVVSSALQSINKDEQSVINAAGQNNELLSEAWFSFDRYDMAAIYAERAAQDKSTFQGWDRTGDLYVRAFRSGTDSLLGPQYLESGVLAFQNALSIQSDNTTKLKLAKIYTDVYGLAMEGVALLREIVASEPEHVQAQYELGVLSVRSGQFDKALERFNTVLQIEPSLIQAYSWKAQVLMELDKQERKRHKIATHKRKKRLRKNRHKKKK